MTTPLFPDSGRSNRRSRTPQPRPRTPRPPPPPPPNQYAGAREFYDEVLSVAYARQLGTHTWCHKVWEHIEIRLRIAALWEAWEELNREGGSGLAKWWVLYVDPMMRAMMDGDGPLVNCDHNDHKVPPNLPG